MAQEGFLRRWARVKASGPEAQAEPEPKAQAQPESKAQAEVQPQARAPVPAEAVAPWPWGRAGDSLPAAPAAVPAAEPARAPAAGSPDAPERTSPTLDDVARLTPDSDYSIFVGQGVDKSVQRLALKKLFADPHFNVMDRLDMYMDDYNIPSPVSAEMLASLDHARSSLRRFVDETVEALAADGPDSPAQDLAPDEGAHAAHEEPSHNEAAHAVAADEDCTPGDLPAAVPHVAPTHDNGPFHRPHQHLPESQA